MNHEQVSQLCFEESYTVPSEQTARSLFTRLPHEAAAAGVCVATAHKHQHLAKLGAG